ncbi:MAG: hypothetical protein BAJALOKI3v1_520008 [Promethearchaeota archaeon]|nr:MAG: hypothetical protein BAJALOKI3v1_520008 [Candidatus Lokiarchaeota archaeon]
MNEDLINLLKDRMGKYFLDAEVAESVANEELYGLFKDRKIDILPFRIKVEGYSFTYVGLIFEAVHWDEGVIKIVSVIEFQPPKVYPIPVAFFCNSEQGISFAPVLDPMDPAEAKTEIPEHWWTNRREGFGAAADKFSNWLNKEIKGKKFEKQFSPFYTFKKGNWHTSFCEMDSVNISPSKREGMVTIRISEFTTFSPKKTNFFPKHKLSNTLDVFEQLIEKYNEFVSAVDFTNYPHDPYLSGPEAFVCKKCESLIFPSTLERLNLFVPLIMRGKTDGKTPYYELKSQCPNCGEKRDVISHLDDLNTINAAGELFWVCPFDLTPYEIEDEKKKDNSVKYQMRCPQCNNKVKKEIEENYLNMIEKSKGIPSPNLSIEQGTKVVRYNF